LTQAKRRLERPRLRPLTFKVAFVVAFVIRTGAVLAVALLADIVAFAVALQAVQMGLITFSKDVN